MPTKRHLPTKSTLPAPTAAAPVPPQVRDEEFFSGYANSIRFEPTVYDLKLVFGETDNSTGTEITRQHTAITIPWALVKVGLYFLQVNLEIHELVNGKVTVPPNQIPPPANPVPVEMSNDPNAHKAKEIVERLRKEFIDNLSRAAS